MRHVSLLLALATAAPPTAGLASAQPVVDARAQTGEVRGRVLDAAGRPLAGATVTTARPARRAVTNVDGAFRLADLPPGNAAVQVRRVGYAGAERTVRVVGGGAAELVMRLTQVAGTLDPIAVTAASEAQVVREGPFAVTVARPVAAAHTTRFAHVASR